MAQIVLLSDLTLGRVTETARYLGPYVVASRLRSEGYSVAVLDYFTRLTSLEESLEKIIGPETLILGISSTFLTPVSNDVLTRERTEELHNNPYLWRSSAEELVKDFNQIDKLKKKFGFKLVIGGAKTLACIHENNSTDDGPYKNVDYFLLGRSELDLLSLAKGLEKKSNVPSYSIGASKLIESSGEKAMGIADFRFEQGDGILKGEGLPLETSQGCNFNCKFCHWKKRTSILKSRDQFKNELIYNFENYGTTVYQFCDDCINDSTKKVELIVDTISSLNFKIEWISFARTDLGIRYPDLFDAMIESGAVGLHFGLESFNHEACKSAGKPRDPEEVKEWLLKIYQKYRSKTLFQGSFIVGLPGETKESQLDTITWLNRESVLDFASFGGLTLWKYEQFVDKTVIDYADYSRRPEYHGFKDVTFSPDYWRHDTMDSEEANRLALECKRMWMNKGRNFAIHSMWLYPRLRTIGFSKKEIFEMSRNESIKKESQNLIDSKNRKFVRKYHQRFFSYWGINGDQVKSKAVV